MYKRQIDGGAFTDYPGDYERYRRVKALNAIKPQAPAPAQKQEPVPPKKSGRDPKSERRLNALEREIVKREQELAAFDARMEAAASDYVKLNEILAEKAAAQEEIDEL